MPATAAPNTMDARQHRRKSTVDTPATSDSAEPNIEVRAASSTTASFLYRMVGKHEHGSGDARRRGGRPLRAGRACAIRGAVLRERRRIGLARVERVHEPQRPL